MRPDVERLPVLPLRGAVLFPGPTATVTLGRTPAAHAVEAAVRGEARIFAVAEQREVDEIDGQQLYRIGVIARVAQLQRGIGTVQLLVTGERRGTALEYRRGDGYTLATVRPLESMRALNERDTAYLGLYRELRERSIEVGTKLGVPEEGLRPLLEELTDPGVLADFVASQLELPVAEKQALLETLGIEERMRSVLVQLQRQLELLDAQRKVQDRVKEELGARQRELILREQLRAIHRELGEEGKDGDVDALRERLARLPLGSDARAEVDRELGRLERAGPESMEAQVIRTFLQWVVDLPWQRRSEDRLDLAHAECILDEDHYGLCDVKNLILEFLSVRQLNARAAMDIRADAEDGAEGEHPEPTRGERARARALARGPILLFVGPPGVGKTSIAQSIARALDREYVRVALGGARDEADIRGHRRTYVGAMPGRIIHGMKRAGTKNPVFLLDEVDKLGVSFQGDPGAALLEVLDPAQNDTFTDNYLNIPFDLSEVLFIATANTVHTIPPTLLDRMEEVTFAGYTELEKLEIARRYLVPRQLEQAGLAHAQPGIAFRPEAINTMISEYTRESGVRQLERSIAAVVRKVARRVASGQPAPLEVDAALVRELLGRPRVRPERAGEVSEIGVATGLYYTPAGGDIMFVEASVRRLGDVARTNGDDGRLAPGAASMIITGQLGDVMKESARAALTFVTARADALGIPPLGAFEVHIHVPAGAVPKDGPSAGLTIATALASALSGRAVRKEVAMTGEITLRGHVLPIGGIKEKVLGAARAGIREVIVPAANEGDIDDVPDEVRSRLSFHPVSSLEQVLEIALLPNAPAKDEAANQRREPAGYGEHQPVQH